MNSKVMAAIAVVVILAIGGGAYMLSSDSSDEPSNSTDTTQATSDVETAAQPEDTVVITAGDVAVHNTKKDCWTIVDGNVYDLTSYIPRHPGGDEIVRACGVDGSSLFNDRTTGDGETVGSGEPHSSNAATQLESLLLGKLSS